MKKKKLKEIATRILNFSSGEPYRKLKKELEDSPLSLVCVSADIHLFCADNDYQCTLCPLYSKTIKNKTTLDAAISWAYATLEIEPPDKEMMKPIEDAPWRLA